MFAVIPEDHEQNQKRKPRLLQSQGVGTGQIADSLRLALSKNKKPLNITITPVSLHDYRRVARTLAAAFDKDPFVNYILNTQVDYDPSQTRQIKRKRELILSFYEYSAYIVMSMGGLVLAIKDNTLELEMAQNRLKPSQVAKVPFLGVAMWNRLVWDDEDERFDYVFDLSSFAPMHPSSLKFNLFSSLAKCRTKVDKIGEERLEAARDVTLNKMLKDKRISKGDSIWYLGDVGILPTMQGHGLAKKLMKDSLENYVAGNWCYLESSNPVNRKFYQKIGWELDQTYSVNSENCATNGSSSSDESSDLEPSSSMFSWRKNRKRRGSDPLESLESEVLMDSFIVYASEAAA